MWCDYNYSNINPLNKGDLAHLILVKNPKHHSEGDFSLQQNHVSQHGNNKNTFSGIGYYHPDLFKNLPQGNRPLGPLLRTTMNNNQVSGEYFDGDWRDIGTPERLNQLNLELL